MACSLAWCPYCHDSPKNVAMPLPMGKNFGCLGHCVQAVGWRWRLDDEVVLSAVANDEVYLLAKRMPPMSLDLGEANSKKMQRKEKENQNTQEKNKETKNTQTNRHPKGGARSSTTPKHDGKAAPPKAAPAKRREGGESSNTQKRRRDTTANVFLFLIFLTCYF